MMISCQHCGNAAASDARQCPSCGGIPWHRIGPLKAIGFLILGFLIGAYTGDHWFIGVMAAILIFGFAYSNFRLWRQHIAYKKTATAKTL